MDVIERELINIIQTNFPITARPYLQLSLKLGTTEEEAHKRISFLRKKGIIRRLGGVFDTRRLGYQSTLCAAKVPIDKIDLLSQLLSQMPGVTHNYLRNHSYNMWFTLIAPTPQDVEETLTSLKELSSVREIHSLPALKIFKIKVDLDVVGNNSLTEQNSFQNKDKDTYVTSKVEMYKISEEDISLIKILQEDLPYGINPYHDIANLLNWNLDKVIQVTKNLVEQKVIRRFGAVLRHQRAGFVANVMGAWKVDSDRVIEVGNLMAQFKEVSHCYERPTIPNWPYNLFTMVHGRTEVDCEKVIAQISQVTNIKDFEMLFSIRELKKSSMRYFSEEQD